METTKEGVKKKIQGLCKKYAIDEPKVWNYKEVKKVSEEINNRADSESWLETLAGHSTDDNLWK